MASEGELAVVLTALVHGGLLGARGKSGLILSQWLSGAASNEPGEPGLALRLRRASDAARLAVVSPVEGTILSVAAAAADGAGHAESDRPVDILAAAVFSAQDALRRTPDQLDVLRQTGVVDAGGQGLVCLLEGALCALRGDESPEPLVVIAPNPVRTPDDTDKRGHHGTWGAIA